jgi:beta-lactamase regulating signal transducer with metallopeptidase domain
MHEMEHLRRADDWTNLLQKLALVFFPLNFGAALGRASCSVRNANWHAQGEDGP